MPAPPSPAKINGPLIGLLALACAFAGQASGQVKHLPNIDCRVNPPKPLPAMANAAANA